MSRKGDCWDNAVAESTIGTVKAELFAELVPDDIVAKDPDEEFFFTVDEGETTH